MFFSTQVPQNPNALYAPPSPAPYAPPPPNIYQPPKSEYNYEVPLINYKPQATYLPPDYSEHSLNNNYLPPDYSEHTLNTNYLSPEMYTPSIERYDNPDVSIYLPNTKIGLTKITIRHIRHCIQTF